ncbi:MAG: hypothetical protein FJ313_04485, partial [Gemmatimonadetes bacterium]|nr:hypothetical protein [Gemmatimonadota bacterium]
MTSSATNMSRGWVVFRVLLVCTGNQCRSPMAEALLRRLAATDSAAPLEIRVSSAGTAAPAGFPATQQAQEACAEEGIDLTGHRSRPV